MASGTKRRKYNQAPDLGYVPEWEDPAFAEANAIRRENGNKLMMHLLSLYALTKISAKDLAIACHYAALAQVPGGNFDTYAVEPGQTSDGNYQKHLDKVLPSPGFLGSVRQPSMLRGKAARTTQHMPFLPIHEAIASEVRSNPGLVEASEETEWGEAYETHPLVVRARQQDLPPPLPVAIYVDAVRFSAAIAGRTDSVIGIWCFTLKTQKRHLLSSIRTRDLCRCGCRGWCSIYPHLLSVSWGAECLVAGRRAERDYDGREFAAGSPLLSAIDEYGVDLNFTAIIFWIKGDWAEIAHTFGLPACTSIHNACPFCTSRGGCHLHSGYRNASLGCWPWPLRADPYENLCRAREITLVIDSEAMRDDILNRLEYKKGKSSEVAIW